MHDSYLELAGYQEASKWLSGEIHIPRLTAARPGIRSILQGRLATAEIPAEIEEVIDIEAVGLLAKHYEGDRTIRDVLRVVHRSLQHAISDGVEVITSHLVEQGLAELSERR